MAKATTDTDAAEVAELSALTTEIQTREAERRAERVRRDAQRRGREASRISDLVTLVEGMASRPARQERPLSPRLAAEREAARLAEAGWMWRNSGVASRYHDVDLRALPRCLPRDYHRMAGVLLTLLDRPRLIAVGGEPGTGKTALAAGLVRAWCRMNRRALYTRAQRYLSDLADAPFGEGAKGRVRAKYAGLDLLVLDEVQTTNDGQTWIDELEQLVDERYGWKRATLLIGNLGADALRERLGPRVWRRLDEEGGFFGATWGPVHPLLEGMQ